MTTSMNGMHTTAPADEEERTHVTTSRSSAAAVVRHPSALRPSFVPCCRVRARLPPTVTYADALQSRFPGLDPQVDDLFLLEAHQIASLPTRAPSRDLAAVLHAYPRVRRFFVARHPPIEGYLTQLLAEHGPATDEELIDREAALLWEIADWIVYQRAPQLYVVWIACL